MANEVSQIIQEIADLTGWKQTEIAKEAKCSQSNISKWKSESQEPRKGQWERLLRLYYDVKYGDGTYATINQMAQNYLNQLKPRSPPPPPPRRKR
jgi:transcriptional regulator with XRE-family HTH domain